MGNTSFKTPKISNGAEINKIIQKATIEVNESGTKAAVVTEAEIIICGSGQEHPYIELTFDSPFVLHDTRKINRPYIIRGQIHGEIIIYLTLYSMPCT